MSLTYAEYMKEYRNSSPERKAKQKRYNEKSITKRFILQSATLEELKELKEYIKQRTNDLKNQ